MKAKQTAIVCWNRFLKCNNTIHQHDHRSPGQTEKNRKKSCNERSIGEAREDLSGKKLIKLSTPKYDPDVSGTCASCSSAR